MNKFSPIKFTNNILTLIDQRKLPQEETFIECSNLEETHEAIKEMVVRGAPCIGFTAIFGMALWIKSNPTFDENELTQACDYLISARPTAVNLMFEVNTVKKLLQNGKDYTDIVEYGHLQITNSELNNRKMANFVFDNLKDKHSRKKYRILTHCNTGFLACGSIGTALGVIQVMNESGAIEKVYADETRPYLQGARLTAYELDKLDIDHEIVVEGAASFLMKNKMIDAIVVGADRIANNGDTANKVGTSNLAIIANYYNIPFYVIAPRSSFDLNASSGASIDIELRPEEEILYFKEHRIAPLRSKAFNPSFDITDSNLITGISNEDQFFVYPYNFSGSKND